RVGLKRVHARLRRAMGERLARAVPTRRIGPRRHGAARHSRAGAFAHPTEKFTFSTAPRHAAYFAEPGNAGNLPTSRAWCGMTPVALAPATIFLARSSEASVCERSVLNAGTPLVS